MVRRSPDERVNGLMDVDQLPGLIAAQLRGCL
jgi:hypothetical protein